MEVDSSSEKEGHLRPAFDTKHLSQLGEAQAKGLSQSQELAQQWTRYKTDYVALSTRLGTLADKVSYDVMVPLSPLALVPGRLKHTNEVLVLLGDNWFAERSTVQAKEIVERRIKQCDEMLDKLRKEQELYSSWHQQTAALQKEIQQPEGSAEIVEQFNEDKEKHWREQHRVKVKSYYEKMAQMRQQRKEREAKREQKTEADLWARLDELELQEELEEELAREEGDESSGSDESYNSEDEMVIHDEPITPEQVLPQREMACPAPQIPSKAPTTLLQVGDRPKKKVSFSSLANAAVLAEEPEPDSPTQAGEPPVIHFRHSSALTASSEEPDPNDEPSFHHPGDIFHHFQPHLSPPKSILKVKQSTVPTNPEPSPSPRVTAADSASAVKSEVVEKVPTLATPPTVSVSPAQQRPTSRFKAAKLASKSQ